jgi:hypothetical protein
MSDSKQIQLKQAAKRAAQMFERQQQTDRRIAEEEKRHSDMVAKTTRLREQRLARDAASGTTENEEKPLGRERSRRRVRKEK